MNKEITRLQKENKRLSYDIKSFDEWQRDPENIDLRRIFDVFAQSICDDWDMGCMIVAYAKNRAIIEYLRKKAKLKL